MSDLHLLTVLDRAVKTVTGHAARTVSSLRSQAPGARMIGEFAVKTGLGQLRRRIVRDAGSSNSRGSGDVTGSGEV